MGKINSKAKGANGEREISRLIREYGYDVRRGQQYNGLEGEDVVGLDYIHIEVKRVEQLNIDKAMEQSIKDSKSGQIPAVFHRKNNKKWKVTLEFEDFMTMYASYYDDMKLKELGERYEIVSEIKEENGL
jgi:Holliday junction resolvase